MSWDPLECASVCPSYRHTHAQVSKQAAPKAPHHLIFFFHLFSPLPFFYPAHTSYTQHIPSILPFLQPLLYPFFCTTYSCLLHHTLSKQPTFNDQLYDTSTDPSSSTAPHAFVPDISSPSQTTPFLITYITNNNNMGFAQDMKRKTESIITGGGSAFKSGPNTPTGGMVTASGPLDDYGYTKGHHQHNEDPYYNTDNKSPVPSMMSTKSAKAASYQEHKKNKFSRSSGLGGGGPGRDRDRVHLSPIATRSTFNGIGGGGSFTNLIHDDYRPLMDELKDTYRRKIRPLETTYNFEGFHSAPLSDSDIEAKPMVLLLGQYSTVCLVVSPLCCLHGMEVHA